MERNIIQIKELQDKLTCPVCQNKLIFSQKDVKCTNTDCSIEFPIINDIPILINENDSIFAFENFTNNKDNSHNSESLFLKLKKRLQPYFPSLSNNLSSQKNFKLLELLLSKKLNPKILIIGGATITTDTDMIFNSNNTVIESDIYLGPRTQIIIDGHHIPFENETFDLLIYQAVLEHVADPVLCIKEAHRVLKSDGLIFATTPFMQQVHMKQHDFTRFTHLGHRRLFRSFKEIESGVSAGSGVALGWSIRYFMRSLTNIKFVRLFLEVISIFLFFWLKYFDYFISKNNGTFDAASAFYFIGEKSNTTLTDKELIKQFKGIK